MLASLEVVSRRLEVERERLGKALAAASERDARLTEREAARRLTLQGRSSELAVLTTKIQEARSRRDAAVALAPRLRAAEEEHAAVRAQLRSATEQHRRLSGLLDELLARLARSKDTLS